MKTKARHIISGWPKGRSTSSPYEPLEYCGRWDADISNRLLDDDRTTDYHARQQDMLYEYVERYRRLTKHGECLLDPGYYIDIFGQRTRIYMNFRSFYRKE